MAEQILTVGHSNHSLEHLVGLIQSYEIRVLADVRSQPFSRYSPQFNQRTLENALKRKGIKYVFLGRELGGRPEGAEFYDEEWRVLYWKRAHSQEFLNGITRLESLAASEVVAIMCSEENPRDCHRRLLVGEVLKQHKVIIQHIRGDGRLEPESVEAPSQESLFEEPKEKAWKSVRSVSPNEQREASSIP